MSPALPETPATPEPPEPPEPREPPERRGARIARPYLRWAGLLAGLVVVVVAVFAAVRASSTKPPDAVFIARLSATDHHNSRGVRLQTAAQIVAQDRANVHRFGRIDPEDELESRLLERTARDRFRALLDGTIDPEVAAVIVSGTPLVRVKLWPERAEVTLLPNLDATAGEPASCPELSALAGQWRFRTVVLDSLDPSAVGVNGMYALTIGVDGCEAHAMLTKKGYTARVSAGFKERWFDADQHQTGATSLQIGSKPRVVTWAEARLTLRNARAPSAPVGMAFAFAFDGDELRGHWMHIGAEAVRAGMQGVLRGQRGDTDVARVPDSMEDQPCVVRCRVACVSGLSRTEDGQEQDPVALATASGGCEDACARDAAHRPLTCR